MEGEISPSEYVVSIQLAKPREIAAVSARVPLGAVSRSFRPHLDQVYAAAKTGAVRLDGQNIFLYRDSPERPTEVIVAFGVGVTAPFSPIGAVQPTTLPSGHVATATHWGNYAGLGGAHQAIQAWCRANERRLAGPRWEVYGHWTDDESRLRTDVFYLLEPAPGS
jgi:hypothetical protein